MNTNIFSDIVRGIDPYENPYDVLKICMESTFQYKARAGRLGMVPDDYKDIGSDFRGALRQFGKFWCPIAEVSKRPPYTQKMKAVRNSYEGISYSVDLQNELRKNLNLMFDVWNEKYGQEIKLFNENENILFLGLRTEPWRYLARNSGVSFA